MRLMNFSGQFLFFANCPHHCAIKWSEMCGKIYARKSERKRERERDMQSRWRKNLETWVSRDDHVTWATSNSREPDTHQMNDELFSCFMRTCRFFNKHQDIAIIRCHDKRSMRWYFKFSNTMQHQMDLFLRKMKRDERWKGFCKIIQILVAQVSFGV